MNGSFSGCCSNGVLRGLARCASCRRVLLPENCPAVSWAFRAVRASFFRAPRKNWDSQHLIAPARPGCLSCFVFVYPGSFDPGLFSKTPPGSFLLPKSRPRFLLKRAGNRRWRITATEEIPARFSWVAGQPLWKYPVFFLVSFADWAYTDRNFHRLVVRPDAVLLRGFNFGFSGRRSVKRRFNKE